jgi:hypothetical protein
MIEFAAGIMVGGSIGAVIVGALITPRKHSRARDLVPHRLAKSGGPHPHASAVVHLDAPEAAVPVSDVQDKRGHAA